MRSSSLAYLMVVCCSVPGCGDVDSTAGKTQESSVVTAARGPLKAADAGSRYFVTPQGKAVYLSGSHTHFNLVDRVEGDAPLPFEEYLEFLERYHHNFTKLWVFEDARHSPLPFQRVALESSSGGTPKFDLGRWNQAYFDRLRERVAMARDRGIYVSVMLFNGWSVEGKEPNRDIWSKHPFHRANNINGIDGDPDGDGQGAEVHTLKVPAVTAIQEAYVNKVIESVNDLDNVLYEISNESAPTTVNTAWQHHFINFIRETERRKLKQHPIGMTVQWPKGNNGVLYGSSAEWISPNPDGGYDVDPPNGNGNKVVVNDTDHLWGNGGNAGWVWMSFTRGLNPIFMDVTPPLSRQYSLPQANEIRMAMGDTLEYAKRIDVEKAEPRPDLCSTRFCLVNPGRHYVVYFPPTRWCSIPVLGRFYKCHVTVDLSGFEQDFTVEWFALDSKKREFGGTAAGGGVQIFIPPFQEAAVLYLKAEKS